MSTPRWWRIGIVLQREGDPWTWTFHVRALSERAARRLVDKRVGERHAVFVCHPSDPLLKVSREEAIAADYGPYRRSWDDPAVAALRALI